MIGMDDFLTLNLRLHDGGVHRDSPILLPVAPRAGDVLTLSDDHYVVYLVSWQPQPGMKELQGYPSNCYYTCRLYIEKKHREVSDS